MKIRLEITSILLASIMSVLQLPTASGAKVLAIVPTPSYSHQVTFRPIWRALADRGHHVTLVTTDPAKTKHSNITEIDISFAYDLNEEFEFSRKAQETKDNIIGMLFLYVEVGVFVHERILASGVVQKFLNTHKSDDFDVVLCEVWDSALIGLTYKFKTPFIGISSIDGSLQMHDCMGNPTHPVLFPEMLFPHFDQVPFWLRLASFLYPLVYKVVTWNGLLKEDELIRRYIGQDFPTMNQIRCNMDLLFVNTNPVLQKVRPLNPSTVAIGGGIHLDAPKELPEVSIYYI